MRFYLKTGALALFLILFLFGLILFYYCHDLPNLSLLEQQESKQIIHVNYDNSNRLINRSNFSGNIVDYYQLPQHLLKAVILTEDRRFFSHHGIDFYGIIRAYFANYKAGKIVQGGSTITQQLAKILFLKPQKTFKRKIQEAILAFQLEQYFTKEQILTLYLNHAYFGSGNYGVEQASKKYFNKKASEINLEESALLAGILKAPSKISPKNNLKLAQDRLKIVLKIMQQKNNQEIFKPNHNIGIKDYARFYFSDYILKNHEKFLIKKNNYFTKEVTIESTLSEKSQEQLEIIVNNFYKKNSKKIKNNQLAVIILDRFGAIKAMIGGNNYRDNQSNFALDNSKEIGSIFDNFIYLGAIENDIKINDFYKNKKENQLNDKNSSKKFRNSLILNRELEIKEIYKKIGKKNVTDIIKKSGIKIINNENERKFSLIDLTGFVATIANNGLITNPHGIKQIIDDNSNVLYHHPQSLENRLIKESSALALKDLWRKILQKDIGKIINLNKDIFVIIGSSSDYKNNYFIGFDEKKIIGIWLEGDNMKSKKEIFKANLLGEIFVDITNNIKL
jgi:penicillin-binding protein 1A